jgi:HemY protein
MKLLLLALLALIVAVVAGHYVADDPGFIVIGYGGKVLRTTFAFFALVMLVAVGALFVLLKVLGSTSRLRTRWQQWSQRQRHERASDGLGRGIVAMASGDFASAERLFTRNIDDQHQPEVHYLAAAYAAESLSASARRENYLSLAQENNPLIRNAIDVKRAEWLLEDGQVDAAATLVEKLRASEIGNAQVLKLHMAICRHKRDDETLLALIPDLRRDHVLGLDEVNALERQCAMNLLDARGQNIEQLKARWRGLSKNLRSSSVVLGAYVRGLCRHDAVDEAETLVRKQLERAWDSQLVELYGEIPCDPPARQLLKLETWSVTRGDDPGLRLARARQAIRAELWGQAREQLEGLLTVTPSPLLHQLLAEIADGTNDPDAALAHRRRGLELATGARSLPLLSAPEPALASPAT